MPEKVYYYRYVKSKELTLISDALPSLIEIDKRLTDSIEYVVNWKDDIKTIITTIKEIKERYRTKRYHN